MSQVKGPTQTAEWGAANKWQSRPIVARLLRVTILLLPLALSFGLSYWVSRNFPPSRVGLNVWVWWVAIAAMSFGVIAATDRVARRFLPLVALLKLSLIFPDEAPSRMRSALRKGTTAQLSKDLAHVVRTGGLSEGTNHSEYLVSLMRSLGDHDRLTRGHSERVRAYTDLIAEEMGLPAKDREMLHWGALLHDVGKLDVPTEVLNTDSLPSDEEWEILKRHPAAAMTYLEPLLPWLGEWSHAADEHHLRWDGQGYPSSKGSTDISLAGRIVAVADAFDVMTSRRSYKLAMPAADARAEIATCAGSQFDPAVTRAFLNVGLGRMRLAAGPLSWLGHTIGLEGVSVATIAGPTATAVTATVRTVASVAALTTAVVVTQSEPALSAPPPPVVVAFEEGASTTTTSVAGSPTTVPNAPTSVFDTAPGPGTSGLVGGGFDGEGVESTTTTLIDPPTALLLTSTTTVSTFPPVPTTPTSTTAATTTTSTTSAPPTTTSTTSTTTTTTIPPSNQPPNVVKPRNQVVTAGTNWSFQIDASDPENQQLTYSATSLPPGLSIDPASGLISGFIPGSQANVDYHAQVFVSDGDLTSFVKFWIDLE